MDRPARLAARAREEVSFEPLDLAPWFRQPSFTIDATFEGAPTGAVPSSLEVRVSFLVDVADKNIRPAGVDLELIFKELLEDQLGLYELIWKRTVASGSTSPTTSRCKGPRTTTST